MVCKTCGAWLSDDAAVCTQCGADPNAESAQPAAAEKPEKSYKLGWYKCNVYFALWVSGFLYIINGLKLLTDGGDALINSRFPALAAVDTLFAVFCIALGAFFIYTRFRVAGFKANAPKCLQLVYTAAAVSSIVYAMAISVVLGANVFNLSVYSSVLLNGVLMFINKVYFLKRRKLFTK